ncbi:hypothetical protein [Agromyces sp. H66]|uniref:hypothetical protein n=1 Tax=Agromyces sp. H66 TaxID=2529859 RepID=UPI0010AAF3D9|nr:hypothetical protein [Agromyces sp. H66]
MHYLSPRLQEAMYAAIEAARLPKTLDELSPASRAHVERYAAERGLDPQEALTQARAAQRAAIAEARAYEKLALDARKAAR